MTEAEFWQAAQAVCTPKDPVAMMDRYRMQVEQERALAKVVMELGIEVPRHPNDDRRGSNRYRSTAGLRTSLIRKRERLIARDGTACYLCRQDLQPVGMHVEHIIPHAHGGTTEDHNLAIACPDCNNRKADHIVSFRIADRLPLFSRMR